MTKIQEPVKRYLKGIEEHKIDKNILNMGFHSMMYRLPTQDLVKYFSKYNSTKERIIYLPTWLYVNLEGRRSPEKDCSLIQYLSNEYNLTVKNLDEIVLIIESKEEE